jgi:bifunctional DNA-binding transcriptional regulator/antitoxin component of YhaV-PrlF toxin-antitoxin module
MKNQAVSIILAHNHKFDDHIISDHLTNYEFHNRMNFIMPITSTKYVKSFNKGQITVPKEFREELGLGDIFWLKISLAQNKMVIEPINDTASPQEKAEKLLRISGKWFDEADWKSSRLELETRLVQNE